MLWIDQNFNRLIGNTGLPKYFARLQTAVASGLGLPARRLAWRHTDAAPSWFLLPGYVVLRSCLSRAYNKETNLREASLS